MRLVKTKKDKRGHFQLQFKWDPVFVTKEKPFMERVNEEKIAPLDKPVSIYKVSSFIGFDRGDVAEAGIVVFDEAGRAIYERSEHKEAGIVRFKWWQVWGKQSIGICMFDAIKAADTDALTSSVSIHLDAWPTGLNPAKHTLENIARPHFLVTLWCAEEEGE